jgi:hypothetical protein
LFEQFLGLLLLFFPLKDVRDNVLVHVIAHELSKTVVRCVVVRGSEACVPCWFCERDELRVNWCARIVEGSTSPKISGADLLSVEGVREVEGVCGVD